jgi:hypothetical protein
VRIADLPWYDLDELAPATDAWWRGIASHLRRLGVDRVPDHLSRDGSHIARWQHCELLLSQACGYDVLYDAADDIVPIATPRYLAEGCEGPRYRMPAPRRSPLHAPKEGSQSAALAPSFPSARGCSRARSALG